MNGEDARLESPIAAARLAMLASAAEPDDANGDSDGVFARPAKAGSYFSDAERKLLDAVQLALFPEDGDGPGARDLNALAYLESALTDPVNVADGDPALIARGIGRLETLSVSTHGEHFIDLSRTERDRVLRQLAKSRPGRNWLSLLLFYLTEALMLDPCYGGNPDMVGWLWLEHRPGFPRPVPGKTYRDFD